MDSKESEVIQNLRQKGFDAVLELELRGNRNTKNRPEYLQAFYHLTSNKKEENTQNEAQFTILEKILQKSKGKINQNSECTNIKPQKFDLECAGEFESCRKKEITLEKLRSFVPNRKRTKLSSTPLSPDRMQYSAKQNTMANFLKPARETPVQEVKPIEQPQPIVTFRTAREELISQNIKKFGNPGMSQPQTSHSVKNNWGTASGSRSSGLRRNVNTNFVTPIREELKPIEEPTLPQDERLAHIDPNMIKMIEHEIMRKQEPVAWSDIAGLEYAKSVIEEIVIAALLRPDLYKGLRRPPRGVLLFGPPGTGKTLIGRCIASQSKSTFFSISASSITSKYVGESEKMVRALFAVAAVHQPAVIFIDEIDSMLCKRSEGEQEFTRRLKNEFLVQLDGTTTSEDDRIVVVGATNRPQELDDAARRRLVRRLYVPLPDLAARVQMIENLLTKVKNELKETDVKEIGTLTDGYSCADLKTLLHEASLKPLRGISYNELLSCSEDNVRPVNKSDIVASLRTVRPTVAKSDLEPYVEWNRLYGTVRDDIDANS